MQNFPSIKLISKIILLDYTFYFCFEQFITQQYIMHINIYNII